jgi:hypothetical protein
MATIETVESHGKTYRVCDGTFYFADTPTDVITALHSARLQRQRVRLHFCYSTPNDGRDWLQEYDAEGTIERSMGPIKIPLLIHSVRSNGGGGILTGCIVKITTTGNNRRTLYQHPAYHVGAITIKKIKRTFDRGDRFARGNRLGKQTLTVAVCCDGVEHAAFTTPEKARRWIARMGLTETT